MSGSDEWSSEYRPEPADPVADAGLARAGTDRTRRGARGRHVDPVTALFVERHGRLVSVVEVISPRNKDRPVSRNSYLARYLSYLMDGVHLVLSTSIDARCRFSFADAIAGELQIAQPPLPAPSSGQLPRRRARGDGRPDAGDLAPAVRRSVSPCRPSRSP